MTSNIGKGITTATALLRSAVVESEAMMRVCGEHLGVASSTHKKYAFDDLEDDDKVKDPNGWLTTGILKKSTCKRKVTRGKRPVHGYAQYFIDLGSELGPAEGLSEAAIAVSWSFNENYYAFEAKEYLSWPYVDEYELNDSTLFCWFDSDNPIQPLPEGCWLYLLPLVSVKSRNDVRRLLVDPMIALVEGQSTSVAFANAPEVFRFNTKRELEA